MADDGVEPGRFQLVGHPVVRVLPSEQWMDPSEVGRILAADNFLNTTTGVRFYESDMLYEPDKLKERVLALVEFLGTAAFRDACDKAREASRSGPVAMWRPAL